MDSNKIFDLGAAFLKVGEACFHDGIIKPRSVYQNAVGIVNLAFACELFIKCLLNNMEKKPEKSHELEKLWSNYKKTCEGEALEIEATVMHQLTTATDITFEDLLRDVNDTFCNLRYFYERDSSNDDDFGKPLRPQFLRVLTYKLKETLYGKLYTENDNKV